MIKVEAQRMREKARTMEEIAGELRLNMDNIEALVINLGYAWEGKTAMEYIAKILIIKKQYQSLIELFQDYARTMTDIAESYEELEKNIILKLEV